MEFEPKRMRHAAPPPAFTYTPPDGLVPVLYADDDILVVDKPAGLLSVPGKAACHADCVESRVRDCYPQARIVHRLDLDTSGVMILALNASAHRHLGLQFERRHVQKVYYAVVEGHVMEDNGLIDLPLRCDWPNRPKQMVCFEEGKASQTGWQVLERHADTTWLKLVPKTGRSHQLRVHLFACGHPIIGDVFYANAAASAGRLPLHAAHLHIRHPNGGTNMLFQSDLPF